MCNAEKLTAAAGRMRGKSKVSRSDLKLVERVAKALQKGQAVNPSELSAATRKAQFWMNSPAR